MSSPLTRQKDNLLTSVLLCHLDRLQLPFISLMDEMADTGDNRLIFSTPFSLFCEDKQITINSETSLLAGSFWLPSKA